MINGLVHNEYNDIIQTNVTIFLRDFGTPGGIGSVTLLETENICLYQFMFCILFVFNIKFLI